MLTAWAGKIQRELDNPAVSGAVIATGTNSMAEVAFFLDLAVSTTKSLIVTGAMNSPESELFDGGQNLIRSITLARTSQVAGLGVLVCMNDHVHSARYVEKTDANGIHAFESPQSGPVGRFIPGSGGGYFRILSTPSRWTLQAEHSQLGGGVASVVVEPKIWVLKAFLGAGSELVQAALDADVDGLIIEGFPSGELPPGMVPGIQQAIALGIPVAVTCDAQGGEPTDLYAGPGEGAWLRENGAIFAAGIPAGKAHVCMYLALQGGHNVRAALTQLQHN